MSILYFSTCLQREADKKDLLGLFVAEGGRVPFLCSAARQILQVKLPQQGQSCPEGTTPGNEAGFLFFPLLSFVDLLCCGTRSFMACRSGVYGAINSISSRGNHIMLRSFVIDFVCVS